MFGQKKKDKAETESILIEGNKQNEETSEENEEEVSSNEINSENKALEPQNEDKTVDTDLDEEILKTINLHSTNLQNHESRLRYIESLLFRRQI